MSASSPSLHESDNFLNTPSVICDPSFHRWRHPERLMHAGEVVSQAATIRYVPMTSRLAKALQEHRHLKSKRVLCQDDTSPLTQDMVGDHVRRAGRKAGVAASGAHRLRHTFCSHLAMRGAPARAIQELAGHQDLITTQRYMHLSAAAIEGAIRLLEQPTPPAAWRNTGDGRAVTR